jgi:chemotaxis protein methyltransferase CheR
MTLATITFQYVRDLVQRESAIVLTPDKEYLVEARLAPLAKAAGESSVDRFVQRLRAHRDPMSQSQVVEALTTNETSWYRDGDPFTVLRTTVLPEIVGRSGAAGAVRVWSAACSSGQEAYSIAMELNELVLPRGRAAEIIATDLSEKMVERTRAGRYGQLEVNRGLPAARLVQHFTRQGTDWVVNAPLRSMVSARTMNLAKPFPALGMFDIVFLRNVLIYFDVSTKRRILQRVRAVMRSDAYLFLGSAEVVIGLDDGWIRSSVGRGSFYRPVKGA